MKLIVNIPHLKLQGGVSSHYKGLEPFWSVSKDYNVIGKRYGLPGIVFLPYDYLKFVLLCLFGGYTHVLLNPSLGKNAIKRDAVFLKIAKLFQKKVVVFFHGWAPDMVKKINDQPNAFLSAYNKADKFIVLAKSIKSDLVKWGISKPIELSTTKINEELLEDFMWQAKSNKTFQLLFLSRIETYKGIYEALKTYQILKAQYPNCSLTIAGDGSQLDDVKSYAKAHLQEVSFLGHVSNDKLKSAFKNADLYLLPSYSEGMPTTVLEAMAFGLPIVSRPVGGLVDFFENDKMGYLVESLEPQDFADKIALIINNDTKLNAIAQYNHNYAKQHFMASKVVKQLEEKIANV